ncbi:MAG: acyl transferase [Bacteroidetes bacterium]|nr:acyl transferase [Bacteroidota bacterium]
MNISQLENTIFSLHSENDFFEAALEVFAYQYENNAVYMEFVDLLPSFKKEKIKSVNDFPFLPIQFFKSKQIISTTAAQYTIFKSSGTTSENPGKHYVSDIKLYEKSFLKSFRQFYGDPEGLCIIGLLPSYLERQNSSLIYMVQHLIQLSKTPKSRFSLQPDDELIYFLTTSDEPKILFGVTFALLDFADKIKAPLKNTTIIETGGMKGRGKELTRLELHATLSSSFACPIRSEYGMTELLSQAYCNDDLTFKAPSWMKLLVRDPNDPFQITTQGKGALNVIDLANINSCAFIATDDLGQVHSNGTFEVSGRLDNSDLRGCNLLVL